MATTKSRSRDAGRAMMEGELAEGTEDGGDVAVGIATQDGEQFVRGAESEYRR